MSEKQINQEAPKKNRLSHFFLFPPIIAFIVMLIGEILSMILLGIVENMIPSMDSKTLFVVENYGSFIGIMIAIFVYCLIFEREIFHSFLPAKAGGDQGNTLKYFAIGILIGFATNFFCALIAMAGRYITLSFNSLQIGYLLFALFFTCIQSSTEEFVCRGYIYGAVKERHGIWLAAIVNSALFAALHLANPGITAISVINLFLYGLSMSACMIAFDSIWMCCGIHTMWNFTQNFLLGLPNSGLVSEGSLMSLISARHGILYDIKFGIEGTITCTVIYILLIAFALWYAKKKGKI